MSFGFSPSDITNLIVTIKRTYDAWHSAGDKYADITQTLRSFGALLQRIYHRLEDPHDGRSSPYWEDMEVILKGCRAAIHGLDAVVTHHSAMTHLDRLKLGVQNVAGYKEQLVRHMSLLTPFLLMLEMDSIGKDIRSLPNSLSQMPNTVQIALPIALGNMIDARLDDGQSTLCSTWTLHENDDRQAFRELRRSLHDIGVKDSDIRNYQPQLIDFIQSIVGDGLAREVVAQEIPREKTELLDRSTPTNVQEALGQSDNGQIQQISNVPRIIEESSKPSSLVQSSTVHAGDLFQKGPTYRTGLAAEKKFALRRTPAISFRPRRLHSLQNLEPRGAHYDLGGLNTIHGGPSVSDANISATISPLEDMPTFHSGVYDESKEETFDFGSAIDGQQVPQTYRLDSAATFGSGQEKVVTGSDVESKSIDIGLSIYADGHPQSSDTSSRIEIVTLEPYEIMSMSPTYTACVSDDPGPVRVPVSSSRLDIGLNQDDRAKARDLRSNQSLPNMRTFQEEPVYTSHDNYIFGEGGGAGHEVKVEQGIPELQSLNISIAYVQTRPENETHRPITDAQNGKKTEIETCRKGSSTNRRETAVLPSRERAGTAAKGPSRYQSLGSQRESQLVREEWAPVYNILGGVDPSSIVQDSFALDKARSLYPGLFQNWPSRASTSINHPPTLDHSEKVSVHVRENPLEISLKDVNHGIRKRVTVMCGGEAEWYTVPIEKGVRVGAVKRLPGSNLRPDGQPEVTFFTIRMLSEFPLARAENGRDVIATVNLGCTEVERGWLRTIYLPYTDVQPAITVSDRSPRRFAGLGICDSENPERIGDLLFDVRHECEGMMHHGVKH